MSVSRHFYIAYVLRVMVQIWTSPFNSATKFEWSWQTGKLWLISIIDANITLKWRRVLKKTQTLSTDPGMRNVWLAIMHFESETITKCKSLSSILFVWSLGDKRATNHHHRQWLQLSNSQTSNSSSSGSRQAREELKKRKIIYIQFPRWWAH